MATVQDIKPQANVPAQKQQLDISALINKPEFKKQLAAALPKVLDADRMARVITTEFRKTPALLQCEQTSLLGCIMQAAQLGLEPGSALGHCYLLPFGNGKSATGQPNANLIIGYRGMIDLARRSGQLLSINAYVVHDGDEFEWELGINPTIKHKPNPDAEGNPITHVYAVANLKGGGCQFEVMTRKSIEAVRKQSKAGSNGPWVSHWDEMARKTVIRRLFKYLPVSIEMARAVQIDERTDRGETVNFIDGEIVDLGDQPLIE